ncbi:MAG: hypothetical protein KC591_15275 [Gemmatimonadetes bacterium]|nr:hypothetical protein [Gemmatimonadota bacterium]
MTPAHRHPAPDAWRRWVEDPSAPEAAELEAHLARCESCRALVDGLRLAAPARRVAHWEEAPEDLVRAVFARTAERAPARPARTRPVPYEPLDIRGAAIAGDTGTRIASRSLEGGEIGVFVTPPAAEGTWKIRGKVWLRDEALADTELRLVLAQGEHVLASTTTRSGQDFVLEEVLAPGWQLELHLPTGDVWTLEDPEGE